MAAGVTCEISTRMAESATAAQARRQEHSRITRGRRVSAVTAQAWIHGVDFPSTFHGGCRCARRGRLGWLHSHL